MAGVLVVPTRALYQYLTDRIGNIGEIQPYFRIYQRLSLPPCVFAVIEVEHDAVDYAAPLIGKGTDGRALR
ncbi:MAG: hypothetical protein M3Q10_02575 [Chloroflexota bacterium]|nr:hypothetical protein [Chloroflexota bacterium]